MQQNTKVTAPQMGEWMLGEILIPECFLDSSENITLRKVNLPDPTLREMLLGAID